MPKALPLSLLAAGLSLVSIASASAQTRTQVDGDGNDVRTTSYGHGPGANFVIRGKGLNVEAFAGPCPGRRSSETFLSEEDEHRRLLLMGSCIVD